MIIEQTVIDFLAERLTVPVVAEVPADLPDTFVTVELTSGGERNQVASAMLAIRSRCKSSKYDAAVLNESVKAAMRDLPQVTAVTGCHLNSAYDFPDSARKLYGYQAVYDVNYYD